ncbi:integral membrane protein [Glonium stellatum]|uniref:Integral membrane protein n=1 Tax=Glonium stellatum TaxID=574774 RepID=A0A8E2FAS6_9PEZI|nr:integral membrane protein [Glonium stellatum]
MQQNGAADGSIPPPLASPKRSQSFRPERLPLRNHRSFRLDPARVTGPFAFINPTSANFRHTSSLESHDKAPSQSSSEEVRPSDPAESIPKNEQPASVIEYKWTSRNNRKGRHALAVNPANAPADTQYLTPLPTSSLREIGRGILRMLTKFPIWDVSYDVATIFTLGSVVWVINSFFVFLPLVRPSTEFSTEILYGGGITAFVGATIFEFGSILLMFEAVNENRTGCFGWALERALSDTAHEGGAAALQLRPSASACVHHHGNRRNLVGKGASIAATSTASASSDEGPKSWAWFPSYADLRTHYFHELGFIASLAQLLGATVFWISGFTALPGIYDHMSTGLTNGIYWTPQVIGGSGFIISGTLFMIETQSKWWKPAFTTLGWHVGFWNFIGGVGFTLCPCFGYDLASWSQFQSALSTFWGSWAFLIGSVAQWYEALDKHPVEVDETIQSEKNEQGGEEAEHPGK